MIAGILSLSNIFTEFTDYIVSDISPLLWGSSFLEYFSFGDGDVDGGVVFGVGGSVVLWSMVRGFLNSSWNWDLDYRCWHRRSRG